MMNDSTRTLLKELLSLPTPTGFELAGMRLLAARLRDAAVPGVRFDVHGNLHACLNPDAPLRVMIEGHGDEIGFMVQHIDDDGFLYMCPLGGVTVPLLAGERLVIQGRNGPVYGVFGVRPPHLLSAKDRENVAPKEIREIAVDIGARNQAEALELVDLGSPAVVASGWLDLANNRAACRGFDNRIGAFIVTEAMRRLAREQLKVAVHMVASVQEEVGLVGGTTAAYDIRPHIGLCVDVTFATDAQKEDRKIAGDIRLGAGPALAIGPTYHTALNARVVEAAEKARIPLQRQVRNRGTGTCAWAMRLSRSGAAVVQLSIPLRYMHSPVEVLSLDDAARTIDLLCATLLDLPADLDLCPS
ncbi:MAG TPA: M42 family peptidase [Kiritimatiellia bacterium]|jgi:endoglucanase|nr:M42 family peptidase [Kiritimatiellia bacterium]HPW75858.1 M42 family peptidase [Kiritimatiellia bacterium]HQA39248.1 M42 family peptidase [Kiritimatiellia bacterium]